MAGGVNYFEHFYQQVSHDTALLERNANDYPCSSLAGFLLLYHYKKTNHPGFDTLAKKTALHFSNPLWLEFLLSQTDEKTAESQVDHSPECREEQHEAIEKPEEIVQPLYEPTSENNIQNEPEEIAAALHEPTLKNDIEEAIEIKSSGDDTPQPDENENPALMPEISPEETFQPDIKQILEARNPVVEEIGFEPLHTVDYFASQGIKITEEPATNDKLGNQVKSFTAWLKSMKRLHPSNSGDQNTATETLIQNSAEESNIKTEILTEAMAEVLVKQDKKEKAIEMYNKLSLINPSKSVYFAAKIESIKSS
jgi:hypothetical protein